MVQCPYCLRPYDDTHRDGQCCRPVPDYFSIATSIARNAAREVQQDTWEGFNEVA